MADAQVVQVGNGRGQGRAEAGDHLGTLIPQRGQVAPTHPSQDQTVRRFATLHV
jgi:hypothetical protein